MKGAAGDHRRQSDSAVGPLRCRDGGVLAVDAEELRVAEAWQLSDALVEVAE